jgi:hypothetical protein
MAFDFKTATPEAAISDSNLLFGAPSYASVNPAVYPVSTLRNLLLGGGSAAIAAGKTLTVSETLTLTASAAGQTYTFPTAGGTVALLNAANLFTTANTFSPLTDVVSGTFRRGPSGTVSILQIQDDSNNVLSNFTKDGFLTLGRSNALSGQLLFANSGSANLVTVKAPTGSNAWTFTLPSSGGTNNYVLTTDGTGVTTWAAVTAGGITGVVDVTNGGTGVTALTQHGVLIGNAANDVNVTSAGSAGQLLASSGASADPNWTTATFPSTATSTGAILRADGTNWSATTATYPATTAAGTILASGSANTISASATPVLGVAGTTAGTIGLSGATSGVVTLQTANAAGTWSLTLPTSGGTSGYVLQTDGTGISSWFNLFGTANTWTANQSFSAQVLLKDGTAASPSLAFSNYTGTGIYSYGANTIGFSINGVYAAQFDASSHLLIGTADDGVSGANSITVAAAGDCGITIRSGSANSGNLYFSDATVGSGEYDGSVKYNQNTQTMTLGTAAVDRLTISSTGNIYPSTTPSTTMTDGFFYMPSGAGAPTGVPTSISGYAPFFYDTTNNYLYVYNPTGTPAWKKVSFADNFLTQE